jgi:cysteine desulfurase/selenocysteine lyase
VSAETKTSFANGLDIERIRADFPILHQEIHGCPLAFLDNAASSQRPSQVIDAVDHYYRHDHANVHRGVHTLSHRATDAYEGAREKVRAFLNAAHSHEIVFTRGTTEAINLVAASLGQSITAGDEILITHLEHHSNIVPWQMLCERTGAVLRVAPIDLQGAVLLETMLSMINERTRLVAVAHVSNALGSINPVKDIIEAAHAAGAPVLLDGAQATLHGTVDVRELGCEFYAFSGHKMCGPTGIGALYGREDWLDKLPPWQGGGEMILSVSFDDIVYNKLPYKFEAGTPDIAGAIGLGAAIDYLSDIGLERIAAYESQLLHYLTERLQEIEGLRLIGTAAKKAAVQSFNVDGIHPHDLGTVLDHKGVAIRTGHHCAMPVMEFFGVPGTARASLAFYNTTAEVDQLIDALHVAREILA